MSANQFFREQHVACNRIGLRNRVLTLACEVIVGQNRTGKITHNVRIWRVEWCSEWLDLSGKRHITRCFDFVPEYELTPVESEAA